MRLVSLLKNSMPAVGAVRGDEIADPSTLVSDTASLLALSHDTIAAATRHAPRDPRTASASASTMRFMRTRVATPSPTIPLPSFAAPSGLRIATRVNGAVMQDANTDDMIFPVSKLVALMSEVMTLEIGDVIVSGTPRGVGYARNPPVWLQPGDVCELEIESIGTLRNTVAAAQH